MSTQILTGVKVQGQTAASAAIATLVVNYNSDGSLDFAIPQGDRLIYTGDNPVINKLLELIFVGTGGLPAGTKLFGFA
jgi:hypothetical protein